MATIGGKPLSSLRVVDLKEELEKRGLSKSGVGKDLVERLSEWMLTNSEGGGAPPGEEAGVAVGSPPNVNLAQNLAENDMVQEYLRMRQQNFESTMSEVASSSPSSQKELKQDEAEEAKIEQEAKRQAEEAKQEEERLALEAKRQEEARKEQERLAEEARQEQLALEAKKEQERLAKEAKKEQERLAKEAQKEQERLAKEAKKEQERLAKEAQNEQERLALEAQKEQERLAKEAQKEQERLAKEAQKEQERLTAEKERAAENERLALEKKRAAEKHALEAKRQEEARKEQERLAEESRHEQELLANEAKKEQEAKEAQMKQERLAKEAQQEKERLEAEAQRKEEAQKEKQRQEQEDKQAREEEAKRKGEKKEQTPDQQTEQKVQQSSPDDEDGKEDEIIVAASPIDLDMDSTVNNEPSREEDNRQDEEQTFVSELQAAEAPPPPEEVTYRKLNRQQTSEGSKRSAKRGWGKTSRSNSGEMDESISSSQLKDIVPDIKPYLEDLNAAAGPDEPDQMIMEIEEQQPANHKTLPVPTTGPTPVAAKQHNKSSKDTMPSNTGKTCVICVRKLVRPFTTGQLRELLSRTGTIADFWIDKIKSTALVEYSSQDEAEETLMALDGVRWPSVGPKTLEVTFSSRDLLHQAKTDNAVPQATKDRDLRKQPPASQPQKRKRSRSRSKERPAKQPREEETAKPKISLDTLFRKTKAMPCIYWQPKAAAAAASKDNKAK